MSTEISNISKISLVPQTEKAYFDSIEGLRAIAIIGVLAVHITVPGADLGWLGVDLFFCLEWIFNHNAHGQRV